MLPLFVILLYLKYMVTGENNYLAIYDQQRVGDFKDAELARSGFHCAAICTSSIYCWVASYNSATSECQLSEVREQNITGHLVADADWMSLVIRSEANIGAHCNTDSDCSGPNTRCLYNNFESTPRWRCLCDHRAEYNAEYETCDIQCTAYLDTFSKTEGIFITKYNLNTIPTILPMDENCTQACVDYGQKCAGVNFMNNTNQCYLSSVTYQQLLDGDPSQITSDSDAVVYSRDCNFL